MQPPLECGLLRAFEGTLADVLTAVCTAADTQSERDLVGKIVRLWATRSVFPTAAQARLDAAVAAAGGTVADSGSGSAPTSTAAPSTSTTTTTAPSSVSATGAAVPSTATPSTGAPTPTRQSGFAPATSRFSAVVVDDAKPADVVPPPMQAMVAAAAAAAAIQKQVGDRVSCSHSLVLAHPSASFG